MITKAALISSAIAPAFAVVGQLQSTVEPPPVRSSVWSVPRLVAVTKGCRSICASPVPGVTASLTPSTIPPTTRLAAASARGPNVSPSVVPPPLVVCCCSTAPDPSVPVPSTLSYSNTDQAQTACCWPAKLKVSEPALGAGPMARKQVMRVLPAAALRVLAT